MGSGAGLEEKWQGTHIRCIRLSLVMSDDLSCVTRPASLPDKEDKRRVIGGRKNRTIKVILEKELQNPIPQLLLSRGFLIYTITGLYQLDCKYHVVARTVRCVGFHARQTIFSDAQDGTQGSDSVVVREVDVTVTNSELKPSCGGTMDSPLFWLSLLGRTSQCSRGGVFMGALHTHTHTHTRLCSNVQISLKNTILNKVRRLLYNFFSL